MKKNLGHWRGGKGIGKRPLDIESIRKNMSTKPDVQMPVQKTSIDILRERIQELRRQLYDLQHRL